MLFLPSYVTIFIALFCSVTLALPVPEAGHPHILCFLKREAQGIAERTPQGIAEREAQGIAERWDGIDVYKREAQGIAERTPQGIAEREAQGIAERTPQGIAGRDAQGIAERDGADVAVTVGGGVGVVVPPVTLPPGIGPPKVPDGEFC